MKKFSEIAKDDIHLAGEKMSLQDIVGKSIIITGYKITKSKFKDLGIQNPLIKKYGGNHIRIYKTPI